MTMPSPKYQPSNVDPLEHACPICKASPGQACNAPRRKGSPHLARQDRAARAERRRWVAWLTEHWNDEPDMEG